MIFGRTKLELKVGVFVFIGLVILSVFVLSIGGFKTWTSGYRVHFIFNFSNGVKLGAPVRYAGVDVGEVKEIKFVSGEDANNLKVDIECWVNKEVKIPRDSTVWVNTLGLLGEKYIEIMPGKDYVGLLSEHEQLKGEDPIPMQEVTALAKKIAEDIDETILKIKSKDGTIGMLIGDDALYKELEAFAVDIRKHPWKLFWKTKEKPEKK